MAVLLEKKEQPYKQKISKISPTIPVVICYGETFTG
jgi:hypothetical protein